jgi:hypothetical protein
MYVPVFGMVCAMERGTKNNVIFLSIDFRVFPSKYIILASVLCLDQLW